MTQLLGIGSVIKSDEAGHEGTVTGFSAMRDTEGTLRPMVITRLTDGTRHVISGSTIEAELGKNTESACEQACDQVKPKARAK